MRFWQTQYPGLVCDYVYEDLVEQPEAEIRRLLDYCGLPFDPACLRFHEVERQVRTASAGQVRQPLNRNTALSGHYGALLNRSEEHTSELQSIMRISYAVFCLKKKKILNTN